MCDYSTKMDELVADLAVAFHNGGSRNEEVRMEYSPDSANVPENHHLFLGSIDNPRINVTMDGIEVREKYA